MISTTQIGKLIKQAREQVGQTQAELALRAGVNRNTILKLESAGSVELRTLLAVCDVLGLDLELVPQAIAGKVGAAKRNDNAFLHQQEGDDRATDRPRSAGLVGSLVKKRAASTRLVGPSGPRGPGKKDEQ